MQQKSLMKELNNRREYIRGSLDESEVGNNPFSLFEAWIKEAYDASVAEPNAMCLSTVSKNNRPSSRMVLLRDYTYKGFVFYTNYRSRKGNDLKNNNYAALNFFWAEQERQIRIEGKVEKIDTIISDLYFLSRPLESKVAAIISPQSKVIVSRNTLLNEFNQLKAECKDKEPARPDFWGGYIIIPDRIEFWQGREYRLHDRICFEKKNNKWEVSRLAP